MTQETAVIDPKGGLNQSGLRDQNARLVLSYIRRHGAIASADVARRSGLSAQTVSIIVRNLEADGLLKRGETVKGRIGKPSVPLMLAADGAHSLGLNIGRRTLELVLVDFLGRQVASVTKAYPFPVVSEVFDFVAKETPKLLKNHAIERSRVVGLGVARPNQIWDWLELTGAPPASMDEWRALDLETSLAGATQLQVHVENDATAGCIAEHMLGRGHQLQDFAYLFVGTFVGGGLVLDGRVISGRTHNAAAFGALPVPDGSGGTQQLLDVASLHVLESAVRRKGDPNCTLNRENESWDAMGSVLDDWIDETGRMLAVACAATMSIVEIEAILVDGAFPEDVRRRLTARVDNEFSQLDVTGIQKPAIEQGVVGRRARSIGAALLPIHANFFLT